MTRTIVPTRVVSFWLLLAAAILSGCGASARSSGDPRAARPEKMPEGAIGAYFSSEEPGERWALLDERGAQLCELPCSRWVVPKSGYHIQRDADAAADRKMLEVPELPYKPGDVVDVVVERPPHTAGYVLLYAGGSVALVGVPFILVGATAPDVVDFGGVTVAGATIVAVGGAAMVAGVVVLLTVPGSRAYIEVDRARDAQSHVRVGPGVVQIDTPGVDVGVTPFGAAGTF